MDGGAGGGGSGCWSAGDADADVITDKQATAVCPNGRVPGIAESGRRD